MRMHRIARVCVGLTLAALLVTACGGDEKPRRTRTTTTRESTTTTEAKSGRIEVTIAKGEVQGGVRTVQVELGSAATIAVTADVSDEVHLHGYDVKVDVTPGMPAELKFTADVPGVFEVELESAGLKILEIEVK